MTNTMIPKSMADLVAEMVREEHDRLAALASALEYWTSPQGDTDPDACQNPTAWRLAQLLEERLHSTEFIKSLDRFLGRA